MTASNFIWYELLTSDPDAAQIFYRDVVGYTIIPSVNPELDYRMWALGKVVLGGMMEIPEKAAKMGMPPTWVGYLGVDEVTDAVNAVVAAGGQVRMPSMTIANIGRMAMVTDPQGAPFYVMRPNHGGAFTSFGTELGQCGWNELHTSDGEAAKDFYVKHCGWTLDAPLDMGPMGKYHLFSIDGTPSGGMMTNPQVPHPMWVFYLNVADINAAKARVEEGGGTVIMGPQEVPGGQWVINGIDPQGAFFGLVAPK